MGDVEVDGEIFAAVEGGVGGGLHVLFSAGGADGALLLDGGAGGAGGQAGDVDEADGLGGGKRAQGGARAVGVDALGGPGGVVAVGEVGVEEFARIARGWRWAYEGLGWGEGAGR